MKLESLRAKTECGRVAAKEFDQGEKENSKKADKPWCDHYKKHGHTSETY